CAGPDALAAPWPRGAMAAVAGLLRPAAPRWAGRPPARADPRAPPTPAHTAGLPRGAVRAWLRLNRHDLRSPGRHRRGRARGAELRAERGGVAAAHAGAQRPAGRDPALAHGREPLGL